MSKFYILVFFLSFNGRAQSFILTGEVHGRDTGRMILKYKNADGLYIRDTTYLNKGRFQFTGKVKEPTFATLNGYPNRDKFYDVNEVSIYLEAATQHIMLEENNYENAVMMGSRTQDEYYLLKKEIDSIKATVREIDDQLIAAKKARLKEEADSLFRLLQPRDRAISQAVLKFIQAHPASFVSAYMLAYAQNRMPVDSMTLLFDRFTDTIKRSDIGKWNLEVVRKKRSTETGAILPDFSAATLKNKQFTLSSLRGKPVLIYFWASWCLPCRQAIPGMKYAPELQIVAISLDKETEAWKKGVQEDKTGHWHHVLMNAEIENNYFNCRAPVPSKILLDRNGKIVFNSLNGGTTADLDNMIDSITRSGK